jgi:hypothetical protein
MGMQKNTKSRLHRLALCLDAARASVAAFSRNHTNFAATPFYALAGGAAWAAWTAGGDMFLVIPALGFGLLFSIIGISLQTWTKNSKKIGYIITSLFFVIEGSALYIHFHSVEKPSDIATTNIQQTPPKTDPPSVILISEQSRLVLYNRCSYDLHLAGTIFSNGPAMMLDGPDSYRLIPVNGFYYFLTDKLEDETKRVIGNNGEDTQPFNVYFLDNLNNHYTAQFILLFVVRNGDVTIHTQNLKVISGGW